MIRIQIILLALFISNSCIAASDAALHLKRMLDKYESLTNYEDRGNSITVFTNTKNRKHTNELIFRTKYIEGGLVSLEWTRMPNELEKMLRVPPGMKMSDPSKPKQYKVWKDKTGIYNKYHTSEKEQERSLSSALSGATGISGGLAWMIPRYLSPEIPCPPNLGAKKLKILNSTKDSIEIELTHRDDWVETLYIDKETYLLAKYEEKKILSNGTYVYQIVNFNIIDYR